MFILKLKLVDGTTEYAQTDKYAFSKLEDCHPAILEATLYTDQGKKLHTLKRRRQKHYIKYEYKPVQTELKPEGAAEPAPEAAAN